MASWLSRTSGITHFWSLALRCDRFQLIWTYDWLLSRSVILNSTFKRWLEHSREWGSRPKRRGALLVYGRACCTTKLDRFLNIRRLGSHGQDDLKVVLLLFWVSAQWLLKSDMKQKIWMKECMIGGIDLLTRTLDQDWPEWVLRHTWEWRRHNRQTTPTMWFRPSATGKSEKGKMPRHPVNSSSRVTCTWRGYSEVESKKEWNGDEMMEEDWVVLE
ncbi:hypothetical protein B0J17DRAFT_633955 [Rhizoctonia solani]|nr:hypothetical protein B0J17DRAFT_633955 [Rhizoctonia solani]